MATIVFLFFFPTGLVQLYIAGLPLRSCWTIVAPSVQGSTQCLFFVSGSGRIQTHVLIIARQACYRYATLTPKATHINIQLKIPKTAAYNYYLTSDL